MWLLERPSVYFDAQCTQGEEEATRVDSTSESFERESAAGKMMAIPKVMDEPVTGQLKGVPSWKAWQEMWALWDQ